MVRRAPTIALAALLAVVLWAAAHGAFGQATSDCANPVDWCGAIFVEPESRYTSESPCVPVVPIGWLRFAELILLGGGEGVQAEDREGAVADACLGELGVDARRQYLEEMRAEAAAGGWRAPQAALRYRWDVVSLPELARGVEAGTFRYSWLVEAEDSLPEVMGALSENTPAYQWSECADGDSWCIANQCCTAAGASLPCELGDLVEATVGAPTGARESVVYTLGFDAEARRAYPTGVVAKVWDADYRVWKLEQARTAFERGGFDLLELSHRPADWAWSKGLGETATQFDTPPVRALSRVQGAYAGTDGDWISAARALDGAAWSSVPKGCAGYLGDTAPWSPGAGDAACTGRYTDYYRGLEGVSQRLESDADLAGRWLVIAGTTLADWSGDFDDPNTIGLSEETAYAKAIYDRAPLVVSDRESASTNADLLGIYQSLLARGGLRVSSACGLAQAGVSASCSGGLDTAFKATVVPRFTAAQPGGSPELEWTVRGAATGTWSYDLWCDCPGASGKVAPDSTVCGGAADVSGSGVSDGASVDSGTSCNGAYATTGTYRAALRVTQDSKTRHVVRDVKRSLVLPTIGAVELRQCGSGSTVLATLTHNVTLQKTLAELGSPSCLAIHIQAGTSASVGLSYTPAPGETVTAPHPGENHVPFCSFGDGGGTGNASDPQCLANAAQGNLLAEGLHTLAVVPCTVDASYATGQTCAQAGGTPGTTFTAKLEILPPATTNTLDLAITPTGSQTAPFTPTSLAATIGGTQAGTGALKFWCHAQDSSGTPSYQTSSANGIVAIPLSTCAAVWDDAGSYTARAEFVRAPASTQVDTQSVTVVSDVGGGTVLFSEDFEGASVSEIASHFGACCQGTTGLSQRSGDARPGSTGTKYVRMGAGTSAYLYKRMAQAQTGPVFLRTWVRYNTTAAGRAGPEIGAYYPATDYPQDDVGYKGCRTGGDGSCDASDPRFFSVWLNPVQATELDFVASWVDMPGSQDTGAGAAGDGYYGRTFLSAPAYSTPVALGQWQCVEMMLVPNSSTSQGDGELALWMADTTGIQQKIEGLKPGAPVGAYDASGHWITGSGSAFPGLRWRDLDYGVNWIKLRTDPTSGAIDFDDLVVSTGRIGCEPAVASADFAFSPDPPDFTVSATQGSIPAQTQRTTTVVNQGAGSGSFAITNDTQLAPPFTGITGTLSGTLAPGGSATQTWTMDQTGVLPGIYQHRIRMTNAGDASDTHTATGTYVLTTGVSSGTPFCSNVSDPNLLLCEDFESDDYYLNTANSWVAGSGTTGSWPQGMRGDYARWFTRYGLTTSGSSAKSSDPTPRLGPLCGYPPNGQSCFSVMEYCSQAQGDLVDGLGADCWGPGANNVAKHDVQRAFDFQAEIPSLTLSGGHGAGGVFDGQAHFAARNKAGATGGVLGKAIFGKTNTPTWINDFSLGDDYTEFGVTQALAYSSNINWTSGATLPTAPWKHDEWGGNDSNGIYYSEHWNLGKTGLGGDSAFPYSPFRFHASQAACQSALAAATVHVGSASCSSVALQYGPDPTLYNQASDFPMGTWHCARAHMAGMGTANLSIKLWHDDTLIFWMDGFNSSALRNQSYDGFAWNNYANANQGLGEGITTTETGYRYQDNVYVRNGEPVSCASIGF